MLLPVIDKIKEKYSYANIDEIAYKIIILSAIEEIKKHIDKYENDTVNIFFLQTVNEYITRYIRKQLNNSGKFLEITTNYINLNIKEKDNYKDILNEFKKLLLHFEELDFLITPDLNIELLKIPAIEKMIKMVVEENLSRIKRK